MNSDCNENYVLPAARMQETSTGYEAAFTIPGVPKGAVDLRVDGRTLRLRTSAKPEPRPAGFREALREFDPALNYAASLELPELADPSTIRASVENGLLKVSFDKRPENQPRKIEIA
ncbi:MAG: Hsp20/alpha crystallin family protein [Kiritimatiellae bacterium]|nr:Hsp20/alpha crystallin family protein [Kiritimatiellia bacterium]